MRELAQAEYKRLFKTTDDAGIIAEVARMNKRFDFHIDIERCHKSRRPIIYRETLPSAFKAVLEHDESQGVIYVGGHIFESGRRLWRDAA